jgi:DNA-binding NtrC family response regulator
MSGRVFAKSVRKVIYIPATRCDSVDVVNYINESDWVCHCTDDRAEALSLLAKEDYSVGIIDIEQFADIEFMKKWESLRVNGPHSEWIGMIDQESINDQNVINIIVNHFFDFLTRPASPLILLNSLGHAFGMATLHRSITNAHVGTDGSSGIIGGSAAMQRLFSSLSKLRAVETPVLILGESGTGKELVANAIHNQSSRHNGPFVAVNCGAIPENLIQSELFGHEKGSFTGACKRKIGKVEMAQGGTIFLDEIGDLPLQAQANLLRFLQEKTIERVGGNESIHCDVRVVAATHVDLQAAVAAGKFREDLFHRLSVIQLKVPALRDRGHDIEVLARYCFSKFSSEKNPRVKGFSCKAIEAMYEYGWPGNVRELINKVRQALILSENTLITAEDLGLGVDEQYAYAARLSLAKASAERQAIVDILENGVISLTQAARKLGVSRSTLYRLLEKYEIQVPDRVARTEKP